MRQRNSAFGLRRRSSPHGPVLSCHPKPKAPGLSRETKPLTASLSLTGPYSFKPNPKTLYALTPTARDPYGTRSQGPDNHIFSQITNLHNYYPKPKYPIIESFGPLKPFKVPYGALMEHPYRSLKGVRKGILNPRCPHRSHRRALMNPKPKTLNPKGALNPYRAPGRHSSGGLRPRLLLVPGAALRAQTGGAAKSVFRV